MSVSDSIAGALQRFGRPMVLRRNSQAPGGQQVPLDCPVMGTTDGYVAQRLLGQIAVGKSTVIFSDQPIKAAQWPGPPKKNDIMIVDGIARTIDSSEPKYLGTEILVHIVQLAG